MNKTEESKKINLYSYKKKYKLKKNFNKFITIGLIAALASGAIINHIHNKNKYNYVSDNSYKIQQDYEYQSEQGINYLDDKIAFEITPGDDPIIAKTTPEVYVNLNSSSCNNYLNFINSMDSTYTFENLYGIDEALKKYNSNTSVTHSYDITQGTGILTADTLYKKVKQNNKTFFENKQKSSNYKKINDWYIKDICQLLVDSINTELDSNPDIDKNELFCVLNDLKIMGKPVNFSNAYYDENNILVVDKENIKNYQFFNDDVDAFRQVIYHESMHIIQSSCKDNEKNDEFELGICHMYDHLKVNPFYWSWFLEAAAEKEMSKILNEDTNTYSAPIGYYDSLILCSILNNDVSVNDVEDISFEKKTGSLFKIFNATSNKEKLEIIKMMYSIEIMQSEPEDFYNLYNQTYGINLNNDSEELERLRLTLRVDILKTLSKEFYKSLSLQLINGNLTLNTVYYLINVYEADVFIHLFYNEKARIASGVEFFDFYTELQNEFFRMLESSLNYDFDQIVDMFNNYSMNVSYNGKVMKNYDLSSLESDANFIEKKRIQNYQTGIPTIRSMPEYCKNNGYSK